LETESYDVKLGEEGGLPKPLENLGGKSATAALGWRETDLVESTGTQTQLQLAKNLPLHYRMYASPTKPKAREDTSPPGCSGSEGILQSAVEPLHEAVGLRMVCCRLGVFDGEEGTKSGPQ
jgi:hypothetical protein